jgi:folate-binding protein YgfZ
VVDAPFIVDRSERGKLLLTGGDVKEFLQGQVTNDVEGLAEGQGCYAAFLTHKGKMLGDMRILDFGEAGVWLDCERVALQELFNMIRRFKLGRDVEIHKRTLESGLISVVGARDEVLAAEHQHRVGEHGRVVATHLGYDVICDAAETERVKSQLGLPEATEADYEVARVESGRPRYGIDLDDSVIPQEADLNDRAVSFTKGCYVGQETVARLFYKGKPNRHLRGLRLSGPAEPGAPLALGDKQVGRLGSSVLSPRLGPIGLAIVRREASPGDVLRVGEDGLTAEVVDLPFP